MADDLQAQLAKRREWFFECQLRRLNMGTFRDLNAEEFDKDGSGDQVLLKLISQKVGDAAPVYLDSQQPVWTADEHKRRGAFQSGLIGRFCDWLDFKEPTQVINLLDALAQAHEKDRFASALDKPVETTSPLDPAQSTHLPGRKPYWWDGKGSAISRALIAASKPWLLPELYHAAHDPSANREQWLENFRRFIDDVEYELQINAGHGRPPVVAWDDERQTITDTKSYAEWVRTAMHAELQAENDAAAAALGSAAAAADPTARRTQALDPKRLRRKSKRIPVQLLDMSWPSGGAKSTDLPNYSFVIKDARTVPPVRADEHRSFKVRYWSKVINDSLKEVYVSKPDSDMGLCLLIRMLYLFGTIPPTVTPDRAGRPGGGWSDQSPPWRKRTLAEDPRAVGAVGEFDNFFAADEFNAFFSQLATDQYFKDNKDNRARLHELTTKLRILLHTNAAHPNSASIAFSPIVGEVLRQGLHHYKFWMDEPLRAMADDGLIAELFKVAGPRSSLLLQKARKDLNVAGSDGEDAAVEMEYWSENHYIMFASSEYLAGQLWEFDEFQPGKEFLYGDEERMGILSGRQRQERGKARVLRWLNHRLMFGWTEFNSSGYYREHLWALLNLVDFAMDTEVREKAKVVTDLLLFDLARFSHKGAMGAAGGRSQFKSKASGWDNGSGDAVELLFGTRGMFSDVDSEIGAAMATSTYKVPDVLVEIATHPPQSGFVDRSRVSITFDEAYKYGIWFSQESDEVDSRRQGYASKLAAHSRHIQSANDEIARTHSDYGVNEDSIVFWWGTSAFMNKQVVRGALDTIDKFGLDECEAFRELAGMIKKLTLVQGAGVGAVLGAAVGMPLIGAVVNPLLGIVLADAEDIADEFSVLLEGSTRTRANVLTYRNGDVMMSSIQNFRAGQWNWQSNVNQVTMNRALSVFTNAPYAGTDISPLVVGSAGALLGAAFASPQIGAAAALIGGELFIEGKLLPAKDEDGPGWWTGYWALPMVVQHRGAAILAYDFHGVQRLIGETQTHAWFPWHGFDDPREPTKYRPSAYEDDNFVLSDVWDDPLDFDVNGHWIFGKVTHPVKGVAAADRPEAYVGVFVNGEPEWLSTDNDVGDVYEAAIDNANDPPDDATDEQEAETERIWPEDLPRDYFEHKDWHAGGKNLWIMQVGSKAEFGDFETFKAKVRGAKVIVDDAGDFECTYHMPLPVTEGGGSQALTLKYGDGGVFELDGSPLQTNLYPRFQNPFIRGPHRLTDNRVEWGQRAYVIEHNDKVLVHDFLDFDFTQPETKPVRSEKVPDADPDTVRALVLFARTGDAEMEEFTIGTATVKIGCTTVADDEIIAVGPIDENTTHDAEWIFFDEPRRLSPDLTIELVHRAIADGDDDAEWSVSYTVKALMADYMVRDCVLSTDGVKFTEDHRRTVPMPFAVKTDRWRQWEKIPDSRVNGTVAPVKRPPWRSFYYDHGDLLVLPPVVEPDRPVRHRRVHACLNSPPAWSEIPSQPGGPRIDAATTVRAYSRSPGHLAAFAICANRLFVSSADQNLRWSPWTRGADDLTGSPPVVVPFKLPGGLYVAPSLLSDAATEIVATGSDGHLYANFAWQPGHTELWRKLEVTGFTLLTDGDCNCVMVKDQLFVLANDGSLWSAFIDRLPLFPTDPEWVKLSPPDVALRNFTVVDPFPPDPVATLLTGDESTPTRLLAVSTAGRVWDVTVAEGQPPQWQQLASPAMQPLPTHVRIACATPQADRLDVFMSFDGTVYTQTCDESGWRGWRAVVPGGQGFRAADSTPLVVHRVNGQLELLVQTDEGDLMRTWWS